MTEKIDFAIDYGTRENSSIIKVIGVGGGGGNAVAHMYSEGIIGVDFLVCNTDKGHLSTLPVPDKLILGDTGLGAGANPDVARKLALDSKEEIRQFIGNNTKMLFITAGMGKGTGTGASPVIAEIAKSMNILTIGVVTYPFHFEGRIREKYADAGIEEMSKYVDSLIVVKNQNIMKFYNNEDLDTAFGYADDVLKNAVKCIAELITVNYEQKVDFNDIQTVMKDSGRAMLGIATASGDNRVDKIFEEALTCPLLDNTLCTDAKNFLFFISYGEKNKIKISELDALTKKFEKIQGPNVQLIWGRGLDKNLDDAIKLSVIVTNFSNSITQQNVVLSDAEAQSEADSANIMVTGQKMTDNVVDERYDAFRSSSGSLSDLHDDFDDLSGGSHMQTSQMPQNKSFDRVSESPQSGFINDFSSGNPVASQGVDVNFGPIGNESAMQPTPIGDPRGLSDEQFDILVSQPSIMRNQKDLTVPIVADLAQNTSMFEINDDARDFFKNIPD